MINKIPHGDATKLYTLDDIKEVWYLGMINGATIYQVCQDNKEFGDILSTNQKFDKVAQELKNTVQSEQSIKDVCGNQMLLLGAVCEVLGIKELK